MALQEVALRVPFGGGLETKMDAKAVPPGRLLTLENAVFTRAVSLSKRYGYTSLGLAVLGTATPYALPRGMAARGDELVVFTEAGPYSYVESAGAWSAIGDGCQSIRQADRALVKTVSSQTGCDYAECAGVALTCWDDSRGGVYFSLSVVEDGRATIPPTSASATGSVPRAVRVGDMLALLWAEAASGQVRVIMFDPGAPHTYDATEFPRALVDDLKTSAPNFDAVYAPEGTRNDGAAAFAWNASSGVRCGWLTSAGLIGSVGVGWSGALTIAPAAAVVAGPAISVLRDDPAQWALAWSTATNAYAMTVDSEPADDPTTPIATAIAPVALTLSGIDRITIGFRAGAGVAFAIDVWAEERDATVANSIVWHRLVSEAGAVTAASPGSFRGSCLASCAWVDEPDGGTQRGYVVLLHPAALFPTYLTVRDDGVVVAQSIPGNAGTPPGHALPRVTDPDGDRRWRWSAVFRLRLPLEADADLNSVYAQPFAEAGPRLVTLDFDAADAYQTAQVGRVLYLGGAATMAYDGAGFVEHSPFYAPDWEAGATLHTAGSGGGLDPGTYSYVFWYEWTLATGDIVRGPTSKPYSVTVTGGSDDRISFAIPTLRHGACGRVGGARENARIATARSLVGDASIYYRCSSLDPSTEGDDNGYVTNSQLADTAAFVDVLPDAVLALRDPIYTTGGIPSNDPIATSGIIAEAGGRLFLGDASDANALYFSQERAEGYAVETPPILRVQVPPAGGAVTGVVDMDGAKIIFKRSAIYMLSGAGPLANPEAGGDWSQPASIASDVGCVNQRSIVTTPTGVLFQSAKGIYELNRGRQASYIGAPVEAYNGESVVRATLIEDANQVRFLTSEGVLLYDYLFGQWSRFTNHGGLDAAVSDGVYHYLRTDGRVFRQSTGYADDNLQIPMVIETAYIRFGEARQGLQRIWRALFLGSWLSAHRLFVQYRTEYGGNWSDPVPVGGFDATDMGGSLYGSGSYGDGVYGGDVAAPYQFTAHIGQRAQAIQFRLTFVEEVGAFGACAELTELLLTGGAKSNRNTLPASRMG